jgi:hypothetical protein
VAGCTMDAAARYESGVGHPRPLSRRRTKEDTAIMDWKLELAAVPVSMVAVIRWVNDNDYPARGEA